MKKSVVKRIIAVCFSLFVVATVALCVTLIKKKSPLELSTITVDAQVDVENCVYGEEKTFDSEITIEYGGGEKTAKDGVLIYPDGTVYVIAEQAFRLNQTGKYTLRYFYKDDSVSLIAETQFDIYNDLYATSGGINSSAYAVKSSEMTGELQSISDDVTVTKEDALIVRLDDGGKFTYAKPIDLSDAGEDGLASIMRFDLKMFAFDGASSTAYKFANWIAKGAKIRLTDCYDPSIYVETTFTVQYSSSKPPHYGYDSPMARASTNTLPNGGIEIPSTSGASAMSKEIYVDGIRGVLWMGNYGASASNYRWMTTLTNGTELLFDYEKGRLYARSTTGTTKNNIKEDTTIITDFNNAAYGDLEYEPFTTGEVFLSIEFSDYQTSDAARVDIFSIGKDSGEYLTDATNLSYKDEVKPKITVDFDGTEEDMGYVAVGEYFTIPSATAIDVNQFGTVDVAVYKNYDSAYKTIVNVQEGKFKVATPEIYYVEYTACDTFGNTQKKVIKIYGVSTENGKKTVDLDIGEKFTSFKAGEAYVLPKPVFSTLNKEESLRLNIYVNCEGKQSITLAELEGKAEIDAFFEQDCTFQPLYAGDYTITYQFADNVMEYFEDGVSYTVTSNVSELVNFLEKPFIDRYLIKDAEYSLEKVNAYRYSTGEPVADGNVTAYLSFDGGAYTQVEDLNKVKITGSSTARLKYVCGDAFVESDVAQIVDVNYANPKKLVMEKYFVQEGLELDKDSSYLIYKSTEKEGDARLRFVNRIGYTSLSLKFMVSDGYSAYEKLNIILTDPYDTDNKVVMSFYNDSWNNFVFAVNGGTPHVMKDSFSSTAEKQIVYDAHTNRLSVSSCDDIILLDFNFTAATAYLDFECVGLNGTGGVRVNTINNQNVTSKTVKDTRPPEFYESNSAGATYTKGTVVKISPLTFYDVMSPILKGMLSLKVTNESGKYLTSVDGVELNGVDNDPNKSYEIKFTEFGEYTVEYTCEDLSGNDSTAKQFIVIKDLQDPILTFTGKITEDGTVSVNKGETLLVSYTLQDETSTKEEIECYITVMDMKSHYIYAYHETNQLTFSYAGTFTVTVTARDAAGNCTIKSFKVVVA